MKSDQTCLHKYWRIAATAMILVSLSMIFLFSGQEGPASDSLSTRITVTLIRIATNASPDIQSVAFMRAHHVVRKLAHATEYGMLAASCGLLLHTFPIAERKRFLLSWISCLPVSALDEYLQTFRPGRNGNITDICIDMLGACAALLLLSLICKAVFGRRASRQP